MLVVVALLLATGLAALLFVDIDSPRLGQAVLDRLGGELSIDAQGFELNLLRGLELERVTIEGTVPAGRLTARAERLVLRHRLLPLLRGRIVLDTAVLESPQLELDTTAAVAASGAAAARGGGRESAGGAGGGAAGTAGDAREAAGRAVTVEIRNIVLHDGEVVIGPGASAGAAATDASSASGIAARGLGLELNDLETDPRVGSLLDGVTATGRIHADEVRLGSLEAYDGAGEVEVAGGKLRIRDFRYRNETGEFRVGQLELDLGRDPFEYAFALEGDPVHTHALLAAAERGGVGAGRLVLEAAGRGTDVETLSGEGLFALAGGELPAHPVLMAIQEVVKGAHLVGTSYEPIEVPFTIAGNRIELAPFELRLGPGGLGLAGWVDLDGPLALEIALRVPRQGVDVEEVPDEVLDGLTDEEGRLLVPLRVTGSLERPLVVPDRSALLRGARTGLRDRLERELESELEEKVGGGLRRLLGRDADRREE